MEKRITTWKELSKSQRWALVFITVFWVCMFVLIMFITSSQNKAAEDEKVAQEEVKKITAADVAMKVSTTSKLYTAEVDAHKTMHYDANNCLEIKAFGRSGSIRMPFSHLEAYVPVTARYKAMIDLSKVDSTRISIPNDSTIRLILPDPVIEQTAVSVDHDGESVKRQAFAGRLDDAAYKRVLDRAKSEIWADISNEQYADIIETAKVSATELLVPMLRDLGFKNIQIGYRNDIDLKHASKYLERKRESL